VTAKTVIISMNYWYNLHESFSGEQEASGLFSSLLTLCPTTC